MDREEWIYVKKSDGQTERHAESLRGFDLNFLTKFSIKL